MIRLLLLCVAFSLPALAQPAADPQDVASPQAIVAALYDVISGGVDEERDWDRFRSLYAPGARLAAIGTDGLRQMTPEEYIERSGPVLLRIGFREGEIAAKSETFGGLVHVFTTYEGYTAESGDEPAVRGINSVQLYQAGGRWWIWSVLWQAETDTLKLPKTYLP